MKRWPLNKAYFWEQAPFFRVLIPFLAGIVCYDMQSSIPGLWCFIVVIILFISYCVTTVIKNKLHTVIPFSVLYLLLFLSGISVSYFSDIRNDRVWFGKTISSNTTYFARVNDGPAEKEKSWKIPVTLISAIKDGKVSAVSGNAFLYLYKGSLPMLLQKGDSVLLPGTWQPIRNPGNPFEFDYATYCRRNNLFYMQSCALNNIRLYAANDPASTSIIDKSHNWCMAQLDKYIPDPKTKGLIQAMLIGDEINLDEDLRQSYAETGIIHIIAISGGNITIFFIVISFLLRWLKHRKYLWVSYAIAFPLVWFYVLMAGAPPSAVRAAVMFSLLAFSIMLQKSNSSLNTLLATAFVLLCAQPMWLFSVGFQLSFVAVLSLILFYAPVYKWYSPVYKISKLLWATVAASIAAEVLTAPLVIYYFHIFPLLFIVANAAAYLFMSAVLIMGIAIIALSWLPAIAHFIGLCTAWLATVFDNMVTKLQGLNPESFHFLMLTAFEMVLVYVAISCLLLFLAKKQKLALFIGLVASCLLLLSFCNDERGRLSQQRLIVYNTGKSNYTELIRGTHYTVLHTDTAITKSITYASKSAHTGWRAWKKDSTAVNEIADVGGKTILLLNREPDTGSIFPVNHLVINYPGKMDPLKLKKIFSPSMIIIGNGHNKKELEQCIKECTNAGIPVHVMNEDGAFILE